MKEYLVKRLAQMPINLLGVLVCVFLIIQISPGDPAVRLAELSASEG